MMPARSIFRAFRSSIRKFDSSNRIGNARRLQHAADIVVEHCERFAVPGCRCCDRNERAGTSLIGPQQRGAGRRHRRAVPSQMMQMALWFAKMLRARNDFLAEITPLSKTDRVVPIVVEHLR